MPGSASVLCAIWSRPSNESTRSLGRCSVETEPAKSVRQLAGEDPGGADATESDHGDRQLLLGAARRVGRRTRRSTVRATWSITWGKRSSSTSMAAGGKPSQMSVAKREDSGIARLMVEDGHLAHDLAASDLPDDPFGAALAGDRLQPTLEDDIGKIAQLALVEQHVARGKLHPLDQRLDLADSGTVGHAKMLHRVGHDARMTKTHRRDRGHTRRRDPDGRQAAPRNPCPVTSTSSLVVTARTTDVRTPAVEEGDLAEGVSRRGGSKPTVRNREHPGMRPRADRGAPRRLRLPVRPDR